MFFVDDGAQTFIGDGVVSGQFPFRFCRSVLDVMIAISQGADVNAREKEAGTLFSTTRCLFINTSINFVFCTNIVLGT